VGRVGGRGIEQGAMAAEGLSAASRAGPRPGRTTRAIVEAHACPAIRGDHVEVHLGAIPYSAMTQRRGAPRWT